MAVDNVEWEEARETMFEIEKVAIGDIKFLGLLPYRLGLLGVGAIAMSSCPLIFEYHTVLWFNEHYVTADVPEPKDLETFLEVKACFEGLR